MKLVTYYFIRDWRKASSVYGTGEVELSDSGRHPDTAAYVIQDLADEPVARAQFMRDYGRTNPQIVGEPSFSVIDGIIQCARRLS